MTYFERVKGLYGDYAAAAERAVRESKPGAGIWGLGSGPSGDPCHQQFTDGLDALLREAAQDRLYSVEVRQMLEYIYRAPLEIEESRLIFWPLVAVHNLTLALCANLARQDAATILAWYEKAYPRHQRLPAQKNVISALKTER